MLPYKQIGAGWKKISSNGNEYISLRFKDDLFELMHKEDIFKSVGMYLNKFKREEKHPDYVLMAPVKDDGNE